MPQEISTAKIVVVGPLKSGKTTIANCLAEATDKLVNNYRPTVGVRILEFDVDDVIIRSEMSGKGEEKKKIEVKLWDCSGDHKYENCWPAMASNAVGVVYVCSPDVDKEQRKDLETWYSYFEERQKLEEGQSIVFVYDTSGEMPSKRPSLSGGISKLPMVKVSLEDDGDVMRNEFKSFLENAVTVATAKSEREERQILMSAK